MDTRRRAEEVFEAALELSPAERSEYIARVCAPDPALLRQVLALLGGHERAGVLDGDPAALLHAGSDPVALRIGAYRIVREIGRGGMGVVYEAERADGQFTRRVAIKVLRTGEDPALRQRVFGERQILASLEHPDIARLLDGGVTGDGRPYLVMEYVQGLPVDLYCDRMRLGVAERLRLFVVIARAVAYAHRNLVVHRDLKPSNILVTAEADVKLLDFGIAKLLNPVLGGLTPHTLHDRLAFTPEYASPEQLRGEGLTTVSDVYSLGVLLYELLTGRRPFAASGLAPLLRAVAEDEPEIPSARVQRDEVVATLHGDACAVEAAAVARARGTTPARLADTLRGDLDAIVLAALRKEPPGRYESAELLAADIERFLQGRPVLARRGGPVYGFVKLVRRHRITAGAIALAVVSLLAATAGAMRQAAAVREQRDRAESDRLKAQQVTGFMVDLFSAGAPGGSVQGLVSARDLVQRGTARVDALADQPAVQTAMLSALAGAYEGLGAYEDAQELAQRALDIGRSMPAQDDELIGKLLLQLGILQRRRSEFDSAQTSFFAARAAAERAPQALELLASIHLQLASVSIYLGDLVEAERRITEALATQTAQLGEAHHLTVNTLANLASVQWRRGRPEAETTFRRVLDLRSRVAGHTRVQVMQDRLALATMLLSEATRLDEAERIFRSVAAAAPADRPELIDLAVWAAGNLSTILERRGELESAERLLQDRLALHTAVHGDLHPHTAGSLNALGDFMTRIGRLEEADVLLDKAAATYRATLGERHLLFVAVLADMAELRMAQDDPAAADSLMRRAVDLRGDLAGRTGAPYALILRAHARVRIRLGDLAGAEKMLQHALDLARVQVVEGGRDLREIHDTFAELYTAWGRPTDAARHRALADPVPIPT